MTLTLEIPPRVFEGIERAAKEQGVPVETFALSMFEPLAVPDEAMAKRKAALKRLSGRLSGARTVAEFMAERSSEEDKQSVGELAP